MVKDPILHFLSPWSHVSHPGFQHGRTTVTNLVTRGVYDLHSVILKAPVWIGFLLRLRSVK